MDASVIIPNHLTNYKVHNFMKVLEGLDKIDDVKKFEVIIVNDDSVFALDTVDSELDLKIVCTNKHTGNAAVARNLGAKKAKSDNLIFIDNDIKVEPTFISTHLDLLKRHTANCILGFVDKYPVYKYRLKDLPHLCTSLINRNVWKWFITANFSIRKQDYFTLGGFDESFIGYGAEDTDFGYRLVLGDYNIVVNNKIDCEHLGEPGINTREKFANNLMNMVKFYRKHKTKEIKEYINTMFDYILEQENFVEIYSGL